jgi:hypothetical protein
MTQSRGNERDQLGGSVRLAACPRAFLLICLAAMLMVAGYAGSATAQQTASISKSFNPPIISVGDITQLAFQISVFSTDLVIPFSFTDSLPTGLVVSTPNEATTTCTGTLTATPGSSSISLTGGSFGTGGGSCSASVNVTATSAGSKVNTVTLHVLGQLFMGRADLFVNAVAPPTLQKAFVGCCALNSSAPLNFFVNNPNVVTSFLTGIGFTDNLPSGLVVATPNGLSSNCSGTVTAVPGSASISLLGGTLPANSGCNISVNVTATTVGIKNNVTSPITSNEGGTGLSASASTAVRMTATHDFNKDGNSDILWKDTGGNTAAWLMNGGTILQSGGYGAVPGWSIVGQRDFNGDGKYDLLWRDNSGNTAIWLLNGLSILQTGGLGNIPTTWSVVGTADFNGDGNGDILWMDNSGNVAMWLMNGLSISQAGGLGNLNTWTVAGTGDFNGDGKADILWKDNSGNVAIWFMNGLSILQTGGLGNVGTSWSVAGTGDFNGDGNGDILWKDNAGNVAIWLMNGLSISQAGGLGNVGVSWNVAQTGDYNGDGKSDILWRDTSGNTAIWFMQGLAIHATAGLGTIPTSWTVQGTNAD